MMRKMLFGSSSSIASAAVIVGAFSMVSRLMGFVRDRVLLMQFPQPGDLDVYYQAFRLPDFIFQLFVTGALSASFIPVFARYWYNDAPEKAWRYANALLTISLVALIALTVVAWPFPALLGRLMAPGFDPAAQLLVGQVSRIIFVGQCFFAISFTFGSILQSTKRFLLFSFAPIVYNFGIIAASLFFAESFGVYGLALGVVLGALGHAFVQGIGAFALGYRPRLRFVWNDADVLMTLRQAMPRMFGLAVSGVSVMLMMFIATHLGEGSVRNLQLAYNLNFFPIGIIAVSYAAAAFPSFAEGAAKKDIDGVRTSLSLALRHVLLFLIPATALVIMLRTQLVRAVFGTNGFDWEATITTATTLGFFALSFSAQGLVYVLVRLLHAFGRIIAPVTAGVVALAVQAALSFALSSWGGIAGLALAYSVAATVQVTILLLVVRRQLKGLDERRLFLSLAILSSAGIFAALGAQMAKTFYGNIIPLNTFFAVAGQIIVSIGVGGLMYGGIAYLLKSPELLGVLTSFQRKFLKNARVVEAEEGGAHV